MIIVFLGHTLKGELIDYLENESCWSTLEGAVLQAFRPGKVRGEKTWSSVSLQISKLTIF